MSKRITAIRGFNDILPSQTPVWQHLENTARSLLARYGYQEIRLPIVESTDLFKRSIGEVTDIVEKEMYTFEDRNNESITLRPEGTASCVRAGEEHGLLYNQTQKLWYTGPMFRYEKPQKGRYRQFHQIGVEAFGMAGPDIDAEVILMTARLWQALGLSDQVSLQLNSLGSNEARARYRAELVSYLEARKDQLDEDSQRRLSNNPLRILDSKDPNTQKLLNDAPQLLDYLDDDSRTHFEELKAILSAAGVKFEINTRLVRGLDYYCKTIFEWVTTALGAQGTVCAGGRYDGLVEQLGGKSTPAVGFAMGVERLVLLLETCGLTSALEHKMDVYVVAAGTDEKRHALIFAEKLRTSAPYLKVQVHCGGGKFKQQFKKADESGAQIAIVIGESEVQANSVSIKQLRAEDAEQISLPVERAMEYIADFFVDDVK